MDSIFIAGRVHGGGHNFGILVHTLAFPNAGQRKLFIAVTDTTTGWYRNYAAMIPKHEYAWSRRRLQITMPGLNWTGSAVNITLSNGDQLALWDILDNRAQDSWVTVQRPDGSYEIAAVTPLTDGASGFWTSPTTGKTYPTRWRIDIPALASRLSVVVSGPKGQEFPDGHVEATAAVTGSVRGRKVTGRTYVEMTGNWTLPAGRG